MSSPDYKGPGRRQTRAREQARTEAFEAGVARRLEDGLSQAMAEDLTCWDCGDARGDHQVVRTGSGTVAGVCLRPGCRCAAFQGAPDG